MLRIAIAIALTTTALLTVAIGACKKSESVAVGGECDSRDDCMKRNDCMKIASGKSVCTQSCIPGGTDWPATTTCKMVDLTVSQGSKSVAAAVSLAASPEGPEFRGLSRRMVETFVAVK